MRVCWKDILKRDKALHQEEWGFHGTSEFSIGKICQEGFKHPDDLAKEKAAAEAQTNSKKKKKVTKQPPSVELLDDGYFGMLRALSGRFGRGQVSNTTLSTRQGNLFFNV